MQQRLFSAGLVFGVGFLLGLGATYLLLGDSDTSPEQPPGTGTQAELTQSSDEPEANSPTLSVTEKRATKRRRGSTSQAATPSKEDLPSDFLNESETPSTPIKPAPKPLDDEVPEGPVKLADSAADQPTQNSQAANAEEAKAQEPKAQEPKAQTNAPTKWWEGLTGVECRIDLGEARALTVRKGTIRDGQVASWSTHFGSLPRIGLLNADDRNIGTVHGVAVNEQGTPIAAEISFTKKGKITRGVIALHTQGLRVTLQPLKQ